MPNYPHSLFFTEVLNVIQSNIKKNIADKEFDPGDELLSDTEKRIQEALSTSDTPASLSEIIENYQQLFDGKSSVHIEQKLMEAFSSKKYPLKIYRGLPRLYNKSNPAQNCVKKDFSHLPTLKRLASERFIFPRYENQPIPAHSKICLFTWVISDGWGDLIAAKETLAILKEHFPEVDFKWVALIPKRFEPIDFDETCIYYKTDCPPSKIPSDALKMIRSCDLILSLPTFYPHTSQLMNRLQQMDNSSPLPKLICIGQYGYIESSWFHPKSGNRSMGLHFLEKGILIRKSINANFSQIENESLLSVLFDTTTPGPFEVENYLDTHHFYLAYLLSPVGGSVYLHALLKSQIYNHKPIDICTPDIGWFVGYIERQRRAKKKFLESNFGVKEIEVHFEGKIHSTPLAHQGKVVRILCPGLISDSDFRLLIRLSNEFVGVRGDQSFSEAVSANKAFFYDGAFHAQYFMKDLLALAENRLAAHRSALTIFRGMKKAFLYNLKNESEDEEWVDENYFQEKEPWTSIADSIGSAMQDPDALAGFKKFNRILAEEHSFNSFLCQLVRRELAHRVSPSLAQFEEKQALLFSTGQMTIDQYVSSLQGYLEKGGN